MEFPRLRDFPYFAYDTETTGLHWPVDRMFAFSISTPDGKDYYYDIRRTPKAVHWINDNVNGYNGTIICHGSSFDYRMSIGSVIKIPIDRLDDTVIRACLLNEHLFSYELDELAKKYLGKQKDTTLYAELARIFGGLATRNVQISRIKDAPPEVAGKYAMVDTRLTLELWEWQRDEIERQYQEEVSFGIDDSPGIKDIISFERSLIPTFIRAEQRGIRVNLEYTEQAIERLTPIIDSEQEKLDNIFGEHVNANSSPQIKKLFRPEKHADGQWYTFDGTLIGTTPKGGPSLNAEILRGMNHPAAPLILEVRSLLKTRDTFLAKHVLEHAVGDRVYPTINQSKGEEGGTGTGRLSYQDPAMQQIPSRNKAVAEIVKQCFLPDEGHVWVDTDEANFEVRVFLHLVNNKNIIKSYKKDPFQDPHQMVADLTGLVRNATYSGQPNAKQLNLSMIFNSGDGAIADKMGMPWGWETFLPKGKVDKPENYITYKKAGPEAKAIIAKYHMNMPGVKELADGCKQTALSRGYVRTFKGRRLRFPRGFKAYKASGLLIQSTSAEYNKENWKIIEEQLDGVGHLILNTHDSYGMSMPEDWKPHYERVRKELERPDRARVPLILDLSGAGKNWWDAICKK